MASVSITISQFQELIQSDTPLLVNFCAPWCSYCRRIAPVYEKIAEHYDGSLIAAKVDIDKEWFLSMEEQIEVVPTLILYRNGRGKTSKAYLIV